MPGRHAAVVVRADDIPAVSYTHLEVYKRQAPPFAFKKSRAARPLYGGKKGKNVGRYIVKRILTTIPVLIGVMLVIFIMLSVIPGDPVTVMKMCIRDRE